jgi:D-glycero-D-manno-heptose 1,7-bisphosphate phosphatase
MKLVILDRDGVINQDSDEYIKSPEEWLPLPGALEAIARLNQAGFRVAVATNQSGVGRGLYDMATLNAMHEKMHKAANRVGARIDAVFYCPHLEHVDCVCRKPKPGMLIDIGARFNVDLKNVSMVGDTATDMQAAVAAGATPLLVKTGKGERTLVAAKTGEKPLPDGVQVFDNLAAAAQHLIGVV